MTRRAVGTCVGVVWCAVVVAGSMAVSWSSVGYAQQTPRAQLSAAPASETAPGHPSRRYIFYATPMPLQSKGYVEEEFFITGSATRYSIAGHAANAIGTMPYRTRIVVRRPVNPTQFKGVVVVEWLNVTAGHDIDGDWGLAGEFFVRSGWAWVGASVQRAGVHGFEPPDARAGRALRQWNSSRYGSLDVSNGGTVVDDSQAYDIYSQVARLVREPAAVDPLPGMKVQRVYAGGVSQSATFLIRYYNAIQPTAGAFDGFLIGLGGDSRETASVENC